MRRACCFLLAASLPLVSFAVTPLTPIEIKKRISESGPKAVVSELYSDQAVWASVLTKVASGEAAWLGIAVALWSGSDAGSAEQLALAAGEALEHKPASVLRLVAPSLGISIICGTPDVDDNRYNSFQRSVLAIERRQRAVRSVSVPALRRNKRQCLHALEDAKAKVAQFYGAHP